MDTKAQESSEHATFLLPKLSHQRKAEPMTKGAHPCLQNVRSHYPLFEYGRRNGMGLSKLGHTKVPVGAG